MPTNNQSATGQHHFASLLTALLLVYIVWGTTYFAIGVALKSMPPLWMNGLRFALAGVLMFAWALWQGERLPSARQWRNAGLVGALMVFGAMTLVMVAQSHGIGSGLMATVVTTMPMWLALWTRMGGERVPVTSWIGLGLGFVGAALLSLEGDFSASWIGALAAFGAPLCWSLGSYASRRLDLPSPAMASAAEWLLGGALGLVVAARGGHVPRQCLGLVGLGLPAGVWHLDRTQCLPVAAEKHDCSAGGQLLVCEPGRGTAGGRGHWP